MENMIKLNNELAIKLQYLEDNMQNIGKKTNTELSNLKSDIAKVHKKVDEPIYGLIKEKKEIEDKWRKMAEGNRGIVV